MDDRHDVIRSPRRATAPSAARFAILALGWLGLAPLAMLGAASAAGPSSPVPVLCRPTTPCDAVRNAALRADIGGLGTFALGTTGGDPATANDDDKALLYDFRPGGLSDVGTGYATVRFSRAGAAPELFTPATADQVADQSVSADGQQAVTVWRPELSAYGARITQTLTLEQNPFTGRRDILRVGYAVRNEGADAAEIGIRSLLDIRLGRNDGAPYFVPGAGTVTHETKYRGDQVPPYWVAFESETYDAAGLRAIGLLDDPDSERPDELWIVRWPRIAYQPWDYAIDAAEPVTQDSAVALLWEPVVVPPGGERRVDTRYGLAGVSGGLAFLVAPRQAACGDEVLVSMFVGNFDVAPLTGGSATIALPPGMGLAPGETATKSFAPIAPGAAGSVSWSLRVAGGASGTVGLSATARFDGGRELTATHGELALSCAPPTATPTRTAAPSPTATSGPSATPPPSPPEVCAFIVGRVPPAVIADALANPGSYHGWGTRVNPALPPSPANPLRTQLSLHNIAIPYSPVNNTVRWKGGCP